MLNCSTLLAGRNGEDDKNELRGFGSLLVWHWMVWIKLWNWWIQYWLEDVSLTAESEHLLCPPNWSWEWKHCAIHVQHCLRGDLRIFIRIMYVWMSHTKSPARTYSWTLSKGFLKLWQFCVSNTTLLFQKHDATWGTLSALQYSRVIMLTPSEVDQNLLRVKPTTESI